jgi:hypothetical protein
VEGITPLRVDEVPVGTRNITLGREGYVEWSASVPVEENETYTMTARMAPKPTPTQAPISIPAVIAAMTGGVLIAGRRAIFRR